MASMVQPSPDEHVLPRAGLTLDQDHCPPPGVAAVVHRGLRALRRIAAIVVVVVVVIIIVIVVSTCIDGRFI